MDAYELRKHLGNVAELLSEILAEIKAMRREQQEAVKASKDSMVTHSLYNTKYEG